MLTMKNMQALIRMNRRQLSVLYELKANYKYGKKEADETGNIQFEYVCHNFLTKISSKIAQLVEVQKALKASVRAATLRNRIARKYQAEAAERRESVLKRAAMGSVGEV